MNLTLAEKFDHLETRIGQSLRSGMQAKSDIVTQAEAAADAKGDGILTCEELNDSHAIVVETSNWCDERAL